MGNGAILLVEAGEVVSWTEEENDGRTIDLSWDSVSLSITSFVYLNHTFLPIGSLHSLVVYSFKNFRNQSAERYFIFLSRILDQNFSVIFL